MTSSRTHLKSPVDISTRAAKIKGAGVSKMAMSVSSEHRPAALNVDATAGPGCAAATQH